jgi:hypothetical protein
MFSRHRTNASDTTVSKPALPRLSSSAAAASSKSGRGRRNKRAADGERSGKHHMSSSMAGVRAVTCRWRALPRGGGVRSGRHDDDVAASASRGSCA